MSPRQFSAAFEEATWAMGRYGWPACEVCALAVVAVVRALASPSGRPSSCIDETSFAHSSSGRPSSCTALIYKKALVRKILKQRPYLLCVGRRRRFQCAWHCKHLKSQDRLSAPRQVRHQGMRIQVLVPKLSSQGPLYKWPCDCGRNIACAAARGGVGGREVAPALVRMHAAAVIIGPRGAHL